MDTFIIHEKLSTSEKYYSNPDVILIRKIFMIKKRWNKNFDFVFVDVFRDNLEYFQIS